MTKDPYAITDKDAVGEISPPDSNTIALDVWRRVIDPVTKKETGQLKREKMRTLREVYEGLFCKLDVVVCGKCKHERPRKNSKDYLAKCKQPGCDGEYEGFIDEYFHGPDQNGPVPYDHRWIACYVVTGGSEGHYIHIEFLVPIEAAQVTWCHVRLALGKTFRGMDHAAEIAKRCAKFLGA